MNGKSKLVSKVAGQLMIETSVLDVLPLHTILRMITVLAAAFAVANLPAVIAADAEPTFVPYPKTYPDLSKCKQLGYDLGPAPDPYAPPKPWPVPGQRVFIKDATSFCLNLPNPNSTYLQQAYYNQGFVPSIVQAEGFVQSFCMGDYLPQGSLPMPVGGITAAHVTHGTIAGHKYIQITGRMDCGLLNINCVGSKSGAYDSVPYQYCGKEPYTGVDLVLQAQNYTQYVEQAGDGIFCMRICAGGLGLSDPCNAKNDTAGCYVTMGFVDTPGFSNDGVAVQVSLPPPSANTLGGPRPLSWSTMLATTTAGVTTTTMYMSIPTVTGAASVTASAGSTGGGSTSTQASSATQPGGVGVYISLSIGAAVAILSVVAL
ncbi:hypothetical protein HK101_000919 [Irineochytrium annulatum]|nr:hypothetical protein HK101_000919 [Irineochytrium annulatum]